MSHTLLDTITWRALGSMINSWRKKTLKLVRARACGPAPARPLTCARDGRPRVTAAAGDVAGAR